MAAKLNIFMVGGRRCGKTTVLSRVYRQFNSVLQHDEPGGRDLFTLNLEAQNIPHVCAAENAIMSLFNEHGCFDDFIVEDYNPSPSMSEIKFKLQPMRGNTPLEVCFRDIPGEWCSGRSIDGNEVVTAKGIDGRDYTKNPLEFVKDYIKASTVTIIAIDTPAMMEEQGAFNNTINRIGPITEAFKSLVENGGDERISDKLILFVPLKCEKYVVKGNGTIDNNSMKNVATKVRESYSELIEFIGRAPLSKTVSAAILPIITIKEVLWSKYGCFWEGERASIYNDNGRTRTFPDFYDPKKLVYSYFSFRNAALHDEACQNGAKSEFCEQPLVYSLVYTLNYYQYRKKHPIRRRGFFGQILDWLMNHIIGYLTALFNLFDNDNSFSQEAQRLSTRKMKRGNGFEIIQDYRILLR